MIMKKAIFIIIITFISLQFGCFSSDKQIKTTKGTGETKELPVTVKKSVAPVKKEVPFITDIKEFLNSIPDKQSLIIDGNKYIGQVKDGRPDGKGMLEIYDKSKKETYQAYPGRV